MQEIREIITEITRHRTRHPLIAPALINYSHIPDGRLRRLTRITAIRRLKQLHLKLNPNHNRHRWSPNRKNQQQINFLQKINVKGPSQQRVLLCNGQLFSFLLNKINRHNSLYTASVYFLSLKAKNFFKLWIALCFWCISQQNLLISRWEGS
jgi:hypothetical protein